MTMNQPNLNLDPAGEDPIYAARRAEAEAEAARLGIKPFNSLEEMAGDFWPEDENIDDFLAAVKEWRGIPSRRRLEEWP